MRDAAPVRRRRKVTFADVPVAAKLALILVLPLAGLLGLAGVAASVYADRSGRAGDLRGAVSAAAEAGRVADGLQRERLAAARLLSGAASGAALAASFTASFTASFAGTDAAVVRLRASGAALGAVGNLDGLALLRARVAAREPDEPGQVLLLEYRRLIADLVAFQQELADRVAPPAAGTGMRAAGWLAVGTEELAQIQVTAVRVAAAGELTAADRDGLVAHRSAAGDAFARFSAGAAPAWRSLLAGMDVTAGVDALLAGASAPTDAGDWARGGLAQLDGLRDLADRVAADNAATATDVRDRQNRTVVLGLAAVLLVAVVAVGLAVAAGRSSRRRLRALLAATLRLAHPEGPPGVAGEPAAAGRDEIGRLGEALDAVRRSTARAAEQAASQAALRSGETGMYADLARRSARLTDALLERLDDAERDEADPDRLALLFAVDHLATRIRHDTHSLLVLAGAEAVRVHPAPVPLFDVLRAAQSRIQAYERVEYGRVDSATAVGPAAVDGVVHLLAELLDNAARHSTGDLPVVVDAARTGEGAVIHVTDPGVPGGPGMDPDRLEELNGRLQPGRSDPPATGLGLGLTLVGRLAASHGAGVTLRPSPAGGIVATVRLPADLVVRAPEPSVRPLPAEAPAATPEPVARPEPASRPAARRLPPRPLERSPALPGGEPMDIPVPRRGGARVPVAAGGAAGRVAADGPTVEARAFDDGLPRRTVGASPDPDSSTSAGVPATASPPGSRHPIGRPGAVPVPVNQEGPATS
ncbi:nitrate- and nitrite sensing domain-containing protein [Dactylosporangium sp. NPDC005555]|uniref:sensor histidine kinase n=1 Tax=Dactylosporangium sp. NPDC005555 TaxID=3154889 RepID=UPI0033AA20A2